MSIYSPPAYSEVSLSTRKVFIVGHPNVGKTSLFNSLTGSKQKVMNYSGSTVITSKKKIDICSSERRAQIEFYDTPGMRSLVPSSKDEMVTWEAISSIRFDSDLLLFVIDPMQLGKQLVLFKQVKQAYKGKIALVVNYGCATSPIKKINPKEMETLIGCSVYLIESSSQRKIEELKLGILDLLAKVSTHHSIDSTSAFSTYPDFKGISLPSEKEICSHYAWAKKIVYELIKEENEVPLSNSKLDRIFLHPVFGMLSFLVLMAGFFWSLFGLATPFMDGIESLIGMVQSNLSDLLPDHFITELVLDGLLSGVGAVLVFVPQIFLLFLGFGLLEQSGFLARGALIIDKPLSKIGLSGKSFLPLLSGFACAIPALLASRSIPQKKERLITQVLIPLMSCSARLPVYGLLISLLFYGASGLLKGLVMTAVYLASIVVAILLSFVLSKVWKDNPLDKQIFHIDLPPWRKPKIKEIVLASFKKAYAFILNAGPHILWISLVLWIFSSYPSKEQSYAISFGKWIEPVFYPMGIDWRVAVALIFAFAAREVFVPALVLVFSFSQDKSTWDQGIVSSLQSATFEGTSQLILTPSTIMGLIVFFMISLQCLSTIAVAKNEMGGWKKPIFMMIGYTVMGYLSACTLVQVCRLFGLS